ncbi:MAG: undecaprenyldiphospho-muramoylpentapeptide beta-N-acetylglucosaminyltransferase, partial [Flavobacteriaceae bacterium]|nr:undecaprenyldiphospho-muramoylpentapeptide beta-N-acetylglucosaminyltransferase [Flavobacteriaceae bacterium]
KIILSGGGTGGHIYPAIAIANACKKRWPDAQCLFVGAESRMEMQKVPEAGFEIQGLPIVGLYRKALHKNISVALKLFQSLKKSKKIIRDFQPDIAIGTGGFASGPLLWVAAKNQIPTLIQEQNSYAGITNKLLSKKANTICVAYPGMEAYFPKDKIILTGNPVRSDLIDTEQFRSEAQSYFNLNPQQKTLLVLGGSLGARAINECISAHSEFFKTHNLQLIWQCGKLYYERLKQQHEPHENIQILPFIKPMHLAYAAADFIISRAGAGTISELALVKKPVLFIPSPNVAENHQLKNAKAVAQTGAAQFVEEHLLKDLFQKCVQEMLQDKSLAEKSQLGFSSLAKPDATEQIVDAIQRLLTQKTTHHAR